jgi:hypothetical protein
VRRSTGCRPAATTRRLWPKRAIIAKHSRIYALLWARRNPHGVVENTLSRRAYQASDEWYGSVRLVRYVRPAEFADVRGQEALWRLDQPTGTPSAPKPSSRAGVSRLGWTGADTAWIALQGLRAGFSTLMGHWPRSATRTGRRAGGDDSLAAGRSGHRQPRAANPETLAPGDYTLIVGLYDSSDPDARLPVGDGDYLTLGVIRVG